MGVHQLIQHQRLIHALILVSLLAMLVFTPALAQVNPPETGKPIVQAVMFWMNGCPHCHLVIDKVLPPLYEKYGSQFDLTLIEVVTTEDVDLLFTVAGHYGIPKENVVVPLLIIADHVLAGSEAIPEELPGLIEQHLAQGGVSLPEIPSLVAVVQEASPPAICAPAEPCDDPAEDVLFKTTPDQSFHNRKDSDWPLVYWR